MSTTYYVTTYTTSFISNAIGETIDRKNILRYSGASDLRTMPTSYNSKLNDSNLYFNLLSDNIIDSMIYNDETIVI